MLFIRKSLQLFFMGLLFSFSLAANADEVKALFHQPNDPVLGNPKGKVTVVEFFDYQCGHCVSMSSVMSSIIKANPDVRVVYKELPIRGPMSEFASRAALAARMQGKYAEFSHALFKTSQPYTEASILDAAKESGLDMAKLKKDMHSAAITNQLRSTEQLAQTLQLTGTPAFFIGKTDAKSKNDINFVLGEMSQSEMQNAIDKAKS